MLFVVFVFENLDYFYFLYSISSIVKGRKNDSTGFLNLLHPSEVSFPVTPPSLSLYSPQIKQPFDSLAFSLPSFHHGSHASSSMLRRPHIPSLQNSLQRKCGTLFPLLLVSSRRSLAQSPRYPRHNGNSHKHTHRLGELGQDPGHRKVARMGVILNRLYEGLAP